MAYREWLRFVRQRNRVIGALGQPVVFWFFFGMGLEPAFRLAEDAGGVVTFRAYLFPGTVVLILLFTSIFTSLSIIEDRREGFLQSVLVAPQPRLAMVLGKLLGGSAIALVHALAFVPLMLTLDAPFSLAAVVGVAFFSAVTALALCGLGFVIAWRMDSVQGFHAVMSLFLVPLWLLSGAFFPAEGWLGAIMRANPLTYAVGGMRRAMFPEHATVTDVPSMSLCVAVTVAFAAAMLLASWKVALTRTRGDLL